METKNSPGQVTRAANDYENYTPKPNRKCAGKLAYMLRQFSTGQQLHRFAAERIGDHALPSTVSSLQQAHGITFVREWVEVPNKFGGASLVCRYWLEGADLTKARNLVLEGS